MADLFGSILAYQGTRDTNEANKDIARANNEWSAQQYATRYQTMTKDLQSAGLNPMLAYSQSPGAAPTAQQVQFQNPMSSAVEAYHKSSERDLIAAQVRTADADVKLKEAQAEAAQGQARMSNAAASAEALKMVTGNDLTRAQTASTFSQIAINKATLPKIAQEILTGGANASFYKAAASKAIAERNITQADLDRALNEQRAERSAYGAVRPYVKDAIGAVGATKGAFRGAPSTTVNKSYTINKK